MRAAAAATSRNEVFNVAATRKRQRAAGVENMRTPGNATRVRVVGRR
jgi:hypothetical protein